MDYNNNQNNYQNNYQNNNQQPYGYNQPQDAYNNQPQYGYQQQQPYGYQPNYPYPQAKQPGHGFAVASLVLGIVSFFVFAFVSGILAIIFGAVAKNKGNRRYCLRRDRHCCNDHFDDRWRIYLGCIYLIHIDLESEADFSLPRFFALLYQSSIK
ncbi:MAG: DUF4190 domain-containing protein [Ruminococcaceae bacterium]|nr:DUF4190 domain-containing protein [Oscillospiraceae bacterium]